MLEREAIECVDQSNTQEETSAATVTLSMAPYVPAGKSVRPKLDTRQLNKVKKALTREGLMPATDNCDNWKGYSSIHYYNNRLKLGHYGLICVPPQV